MELVINVSLRRGPGQRTNPVDDIVITELMIKDESEVLKEIEEPLEEAVKEAFKRVEDFVNLGGLGK